MTKSIIVFTIIFLTAILLRFYQLGVNPPSLDWDEASLGYNAYSILKTGADEYGNKFPLSFRSFDDYKPPLYVYLTVPSIALFGLNEFSVRLPSAILGVLTVVVTYFLVKELLNNRIAFFSMFFVAVSPWSLQFSRAAFEGNIGLFFFALGILFFLKGLKHRKALFLSAIPFALSVYSYHSFRLMVPIFILFGCILFWKELLKEKFYSMSFLILIIFLSLPVFLSLKTNQGAGSRLSMVTLFEVPNILDRSINQLEYDQSKNDYLGLFFHNRRIVYSLAIVKGYLDHWNPDFLFLHGDGGRQHHAVDMGMIYFWDLPFILLGIHSLLNRFSKRVLLLFIWFLIAPLASSVTTGTPHPVRAIAMLIPLHIFSAVGMVAFLNFLNRYKYYLKFPISIFIFSFFVFNFFYYLHQYYAHTPIEYGDFWQYGYKELFQQTQKLESKYQRIIVTYRYDQPYIYYLFYNKIDPFWYQKNWDSGGSGQIERMVRVIGKYQFRNINWPQDKNLSETLIIGIPDEIPKEIKVIKEIKFLDGSTAFKFVKT